jgi:hypothetical protein
MSLSATAGALENAADGGRRDADFHGDVLAGHPLAAQGDDAPGYGLFGQARQLQAALGHLLEVL